MILWVLILLASLAAFGISAVSGGGAGLILIPLLGLVLPGGAVPAALSIGTAASSAARILSFWKVIRWDVVRHFAPTALPFAALGTWVLSRVNPVYLSLLLGLFLVGNLPLLFRPVRMQGNTGPVRPVSLHLLGAAAGFISGFTGAVGLLFNGFYYRLGLRKEEIVATRAANEILLHILKIILYAVFGLLSVRAMTAGVVVATAAILSSVLIRYLLPYLHDRLFRHVGHVAMVAAGVTMIIGAGRQIAQQDKVALQYHHVSQEISASLSWRRHVFAVEWEDGDELELSHRVRVPAATARGTARQPGFILHLSPRTGLQAVRIFGARRVLNPARSRLWHRALPAQVACHYFKKDFS
ncbi:TSUP family transporter [Acetobacter sp.]|uniref:TSUP family transporter n=1 Tax=Acetobacter sp. TaxID=440 RepID=UPI0039EB90E7